MSLKQNNCLVRTFSFISESWIFTRYGASNPKTYYISIIFMLAFFLLIHFFRSKKKRGLWMMSHFLRDNEKHSFMPMCIVLFLSNFFINIIHWWILMKLQKHGSPSALTNYSMAAAAGKEKKIRYLCTHNLSNIHTKIPGSCLSTMLQKFYCFPQFTCWRGAYSVLSWAAHIFNQ